MAVISLSSFQIHPAVNEGYDPNNLEVRWWYNRGYIDSSTVFVQGGNGRSGFYITSPCTVNDSGIITVPSTSIFSTLDAIDPTPQSIQIFGRLYSNNTPKQYVTAFSSTPTGWVVQSPSPPTLTYEDLVLENQSIILANPPLNFPTFAQMIAYIDSLVPTPLASNVVIGRTELSTAPTNALIPIAKGDNDPLVIDAKSYPSFAAAVSAIGSASARLNVSTSMALTGDVIVPSNIELVIVKGGMITGAHTLTIEGPFNPGLYQVFGSTLTVSYAGNTLMDGVRWEWGGAKADGLVDCGSAMLAAHTAAQTAPVPLDQLLATGIYKIATQRLTPYARMSIIGEGANKTSISFNGTGFWTDEQIAALAKNVNGGRIEGLTINISASGSGAIRLGDRSTAFTEAHFHDEWILDDLELYGQGVGVGLDLTEMINLRSPRGIKASNFDKNFYGTTWADSTLAKWNSNSSISKGLYLVNNQPGAVGASMDGMVFQGIVVNGLQGTGTGIDLDSVQSPSFDGGFIEASSGTATAVKIRSSYKVTFSGLNISGNVAYANVFDIADSGSIRLNDCSMGDLNDVTSTSTVSWSSNNRKWDTWGRGGAVILSNCTYSLSRQFEGIPWVVSDNADKYPGASANKQPIADQTSLWAKQVLNLQGRQNISETSLVVDAMHAQAHYDTTSDAKIIQDANASVGWATQTVGGSGFGLQIPYPSDFRPGSYEVIGRLRTLSGTSTPAVFVASLGVGNLYSPSYSAASATTSYQTFSFRFQLTSAQIGAGTAVQIFFLAVDPLVIDYVALRPMFNDIVAAPYVAPDFQLNSSGAENGNRVFWVSAMPSTGTFDRGDFAYMKIPTIDGAGLLLLGWSRLTKGSGHILSTDWAACYVKTTSP